MISPDLDGGGHRGDLLEVAREALRGGSQVVLGRFGGVGEGGYFAFGVEGGGGGAEAGGRHVLLVEAGDVPREAGGAAEQEDEEAGGQGVERACVAYLGSLGQEPLDAGDRPGAGDAGRLVQEERARGGRPGGYVYRAPPLSRFTTPPKMASNSSLASSGFLPDVV